MATKAKTLFDNLYEGSTEIVKKLKAPLIEKSMKRKFQAAFDDAERIQDVAAITIQEEREKLQDADINVIIGARNSAEKASKARGFLKEEYKELFGEVLK